MSDVSKENLDDKIKIDDINVFSYKNRSKNDSYNKKREDIIASIINDKIQEEYYKSSQEWNNFKHEIKSFIKDLCKIRGIISGNNIKCIVKAGRRHHFDFEIVTHHTLFNAIKSS